MWEGRCRVCWGRGGTAPYTMQKDVPRKAYSSGYASCPPPPLRGRTSCFRQSFYRPPSSPNAQNKRPSEGLMVSSPRPDPSSTSTVCPDPLFCPLPELSPRIVG